MAAKKPVYCVMYCGAPYGDDESGHVVSRHRTLGAVLDAHIRYASTPAGYGHPLGRPVTDAEHEAAYDADRRRR